MRPWYLALPSWLGGAVVLGHDAKARANQPQCRNVQFSGVVSTDNLIYTGPPDLQNETSILTFISEYLTALSLPTNGTSVLTSDFAVEAIYCEPERGVKTRDALQILVPGLTYNKVTRTVLSYIFSFIN